MLWTVDREQESRTAETEVEVDLHSETPHDMWPRSTSVGLAGGRPHRSSFAPGSSLGNGTGGFENHIDNRPARAATAIVCSIVSYLSSPAAYILRTVPSQMDHGGDLPQINNLRQSLAQAPSRRRRVTAV